MRHQCFIPSFVEIGQLLCNTTQILTHINCNSKGSRMSEAAKLFLSLSIKSKLWTARNLISNCIQDPHHFCATVSIKSWLNQFQSNFTVFTVSFKYKLSIILAFFIVAPLSLLLSRLPVKLTEQGTNLTLSQHVYIMGLYVVYS